MQLCNKTLDRPIRQIHIAILTDTFHLYLSELPILTEFPTLINCIVVKKL